MKYSFITQRKKTYPVGLMCRLMGVSRSAYYGYEQRRRDRSDDLVHRQLLDAVLEIAKSCDYTYGSRRMKRTLNAKKGVTKKGVRSCVAISKTLSKISHLYSLNTCSVHITKTHSVGNLTPRSLS